MNGRHHKAIASKRQRGDAAFIPFGGAIPGGQAFVTAFNEGARLHAEGRLREALTSFRQAMTLNPVHASVHSNIGVLLAALGEHAEAVHFYRKGITLDPDAALIHSNLADTLLKLNQYDEAVAEAKHAVSLAPSDPSALNNLGTALFETGRFTEAVEVLHRVLEQNPDSVNALCNMGSVLRDMGRLDEAEKLLRRAIEVSPDQAVARKNLGMILMQQGEYREGWPLYGLRWVADQRPPRDYPKPLWQGEPLNGRTLLLYSEQGLGDAIQFARFVPALATHGARIVLEMHPQLVTLMRTLPGASEIFPLWSPTPAFDVFLPLMDVPAAIGMTIETIPCPVPYLTADPQRVARWRDRLGTGGFKVGIVWQGNNDTFRKRARTAPIEAFAPLAEIEGVRLIGLQKPSSSTAEPMVERLKVETFGPSFDAGPDAFIDTAAVIANLDLVVTIDTSVAHLAGAMGQPVWIALPRVPDWRFGMEGSDCPWYPTARLFRQQVAGDWSAVFADIASELRTLVAASPGSDKDTLGKRAPTAPALPMSATAVSTTQTQDAPPERDFARLTEFLRRNAWNGAPELAYEPHLSITSTTIESLNANGLLPPGSHVLDIGCGHGLALESFDKLGLQSIGIASVADADVCHAKGLDVRVMDQNCMDFADTSFDVLWCRQVLQRSPIPLFTLSEYRRVTRPRGFVFVDVPAPDTDAHHEANPAYFSVLPLSSWLSLFARAGFTVENGAAIGVGETGKADTHWAFHLRRSS